MRLRARGGKRGGGDRSGCSAMSELKRILSEIDAESRKSVGVPENPSLSYYHHVEPLEAKENLVTAVKRLLAVQNEATARHCKDVGFLACRVGSRLGLARERQVTLLLGGLLHDVGKMAVPTSVLGKSGPLSGEERYLLKMHPLFGFRRVAYRYRFPSSVARVVLHHHERIDGSGYPHGLSGEEVDLEVRVLAICDVVDAMQSKRPYRPALPTRKVAQEMRRWEGEKYDSDISKLVRKEILNDPYL